MPLITKNCLHCYTEFKARSQDVSRGFGKFCTQSCSSIYNRGKKPKPEFNVSCAYCAVEFYMPLSKQNNSKSGLYFCCRKHKDQAQRINGIKEIWPSHYGPGNGKYSYRTTQLNNRPAVCERCGYDKHIAGIVIHHKDRNRENNTDDNLEVLCACCHNIEHWGEEITPIENDYSFR